MLSSLQKTHVKLIENKEEFASYLESLAKALDTVFFNDSDIGLQYLAEMQLSLNSLSNKAVILLDEISVEQKTTLDRSDWRPSCYSSIQAKLTRAELLINPLTTKVVENIKQLLLTIPQAEVYKNARTELTDWMELAPLLKENLNTAMTTQAIIAKNVRDQQKKSVTNKPTICIAVR